MTDTTSDFLVIGSGIAGLCFAIHAARYGTVNVITKKEDSESNTNYAQGGIACGLGDDDSFALHIQDTLDLGPGLCNEAAVSIIVEEGPARLRELIEWGVEFSHSTTAKNPYRLDLGREGGHSVNRIAHANDLTGRAVEEQAAPPRPLKPINTRCSSITSRSNSSPTTTSAAPSAKGDTCYGAYVLDTRSRAIVPVRAAFTCLASAAAEGSTCIQPIRHRHRRRLCDGVSRGRQRSQTWSSFSSIPRPSTMKAAPSFLISEALRGYGAVLRHAAAPSSWTAITPSNHWRRAIRSPGPSTNEMKLSGAPALPRHPQGRRSRTNAISPIFIKSAKSLASISRATHPGRALSPLYLRRHPGSDIGEGRTPQRPLCLRRGRLHRCSRRQPSCYQYSSLEALVFAYRAANDAVQVN